MKNFKTVVECSRCDATVTRNFKANHTISGHSLIPENWFQFNDHVLVGFSHRSSLVFCPACKEALSVWYDAFEDARREQFEAWMDETGQAEEVRGTKETNGNKKTK